MARRVEIIILLMLLLSLYYFRVGSHGSLFVNELQGSCGVEEREALLSFKRSLFRAEHFLSNWDIANDCCTWTGVICSNKIGHVIELYVGHASGSYIYREGKIPKCKGNISSFMNLKFLSLANNNFWGSIPQWMGNLPMLLSLYLNNNNFQKEMPFFKNSSKLITLGMGQNKLTGNIPIWIGDRLTSLKILCLRSNKFHGLIPSELFKLKGLQILDLADNFFSGPLPKSLKFLTGMVTRNKRLEPPILNDYLYENITLLDSLNIDMKGLYLKFTSTLSLVMTMDLSCNNLTGEIPSELMSLIGLISLNLSRDQFIGQIPINIGVMQSLESLDLSRNHFSVEIPVSIGNLSGLEYLNLSYNQLSGRIPMGAQLGTFQESSYYGNPELCGKPLLKTCEGDGGENNSNVVDDDNFGLFLSMGLGFVVGLWSILWTLFFKRSLAITYFQLCDNITNNIYVFVVVRVNRWSNRS